MQRIAKIISLLGVLFTLSSCGVYSQQFGCPDSMGAKCVMLSQVDQMIDNHEIEQVYQDKKRCSKGKCLAVGSLPKLKRGEILEVELEEGKENRIWKTDNKLYLPQ